jgi:hypothetical protein
MSADLNSPEAAMVDGDRLFQLRTPLFNKLPEAMFSAMPRFESGQEFVVAGDAAVSG